MVKTIQMKLDVNKTTVNNEIIRIRQGDKNSTKLEVEVLYDGQPYSLTGLSATFNATKPDGKVVVENATTSENKIIYVLNSQVGAISGTISKAYFSIKNTSGVEIDSTSNFRIDVLTGTDASAGSSDYIDSLESTRLKAQNLLTQIDDSIAAVNGTVAQINTLGQQASNTLKEKLEGLSTQATKGVNDIKAQLQELITAKIANIQSQADTKLASIQKDWNTLKTSLNAEIQALADKVKATDGKADEIKTRLDELAAQLDSIDIVSVKAVADKATADVAELRERKTYLHTAYSWSADGQDRFMTVYPNENLYLNSKSLKTGYDGNQGAKVTVEPFDSTTNMWHIVAEQGLSHPVGIFLLSYANDKIQDNSDWSYSVDAKGIGEIQTLGIEDSNKGPSIGTVGSEWSRIIKTGHVDEPNRKTINMYFDSTSSPVDVYIKLPKLEQGTPTPYTPSTLDDPEGAYPKFVGTYTDYTVEDSTDPTKYEWIPIPRPNEKNVLAVEGKKPDNFGNVTIPKIAQNALDIKNLAGRNDSQDVTISKLTKSVNGITPDASGNISLPQPDLTPYATTANMNTAITTAKTAMATDAQTKANTALSSAKSYADTKKSEAQSYTDTKLSGVLKSWTGTQAQYDAISIKDPNTLYIIVEVV